MQPLILCRCARSRVCTYASAQDAGNNFLGQAIQKTYNIGTDETIRWGVLKKNVVPPQQVLSIVMTADIDATIPCLLKIVGKPSYQKLSVDLLCRRVGRQSHGNNTVSRQSRDASS